MNQPIALKEAQLVEQDLTYEHYSDTELLALIVQCQQPALAALYDRYGIRVFMLALRLLGDRQVAEEITQDVFLRIWQRAHTFQPGTSSVLAWLLAITRNRSIDEIRSQRAVSRRHEQVDLPPSVTDTNDDVQRRVEGHLLTDEVRQALARLPSQQRRAIELSLFGGLSQSEIAAVLDRPLGTVKTWLRLGMRQLRAVLGPNWPSNGD